METLQKTVAKEILEQLGGNKFIAMTGAHNLANDGNNLCLKFKGSNKANYLRITLTSMDLYTIEFAKISGTNIHWHSMYKGCYNDMLQDIFTKVTGLNTHL